MVNCVRCLRRANKEIYEKNKNKRRKKVYTLDDYKKDFDEDVSEATVEDKLCTNCYDELFSKLDDHHKSIHGCRCDKHCESCALDNQALHSCRYMYGSTKLNIEINKDEMGEYNPEDKDEEDPKRKNYDSDFHDDY